MKKSCVFFILLAFLAFTPSLEAAAPGAPKPQIEDIRLGGQGSRTRIVLDLNRKTDFRVFMLDQPYRLVLDLPPVGWKTFKSRFVNSTHAVKSWRSGLLDDGLTRIIFDLKNPVTVSDAFIVPKTSLAKDRLVIDVEKSSVNAFAAQKSRVFGNQALKGPGGGDTGLNDGDVATLSDGGGAPHGNTYAAEQNDAVKDADATADDDDTPLPAERPEKDKKYTVVVDAGHGGDDPGAMSYGYKEKFLTLAVATELRRQLEETGHYKVVMTRDKDVYITLRDRMELSRKVKADLFVSIHADKVSRANIRGASIYTLSETASDAETARLADEENNSGFVAGVDLSQESQDVADILLDLAMREKMNESNMFAGQLTHAFLRENVRLLPNSHRSAGFAVLKAPDVPSVLIEMGFISNQEEAKLLSSGQFQSRIASTILGGIDGYFRKIQALQKP